jgi:hypothetical protein
MIEDTAQTKNVGEKIVGTLKTLEQQPRLEPKMEKWRRSVIERDLGGFDMPEFSSSDENGHKPSEEPRVKHGVRIDPKIRHAEEKVVKDVAKTMLPGLWKSGRTLDETVRQVEDKTKESNEGAEEVERSTELESKTNTAPRSGRNRAARDRRSSAPTRSSDSLPEDTTRHRTSSRRRSRDKVSAQNEPSTSPRQRSRDGLSGLSGENSTGARRRSQRRTSGVDSTELKGFDTRVTSDQRSRSAGRRRAGSGSALPRSRNSDSSGVGSGTHRGRTRRTGSSEVSVSENSQSVTHGILNNKEINDDLAVGNASQKSNNYDLLESIRSRQSRPRTTRRSAARTPRLPGSDARSSEISGNEHSQNSHDSSRSSPRSHVCKGKALLITNEQGTREHDDGSRNRTRDQADLEKAKTRRDSHLDSLADDLRKEYGPKEELPNTSYYATGHVIVNRSRMEKGLKPLARNREMDEVARKYAGEMAAGSILVWRRPTKLPYQGYIWRGASILSVHEEVMEDERGSARAHILHPAFEKIGVGTAKGSDGMLYLCELYDGPKPLVSVDGIRRPFVALNEKLDGVASSLRDGVSGVTTNLRGGVTGITSNVLGGVSSATTKLRGGVSGVTSNLRDGVAGVSLNDRGGVTSLSRKEGN